LTRLSLPDVALCAVTSIALPETVQALERCLDQVDFGSVRLLTDRPAYDARPDIELQRIDPIRSREDYCEFIIRRLAEFVDLQHVLIVQWDGFVIDPSQWRAEFLDYDYIGAPWPQFHDDRTVGNGGFSLRSRRLLELTASPEFPGAHPEDVSICRTYRRLLEAQGIRFAPRCIAEHFSFERGRPTRSFGFHGLFNFPRVLPPDELKTTLDALDSDLLAGRDGADLIIELARRGDVHQARRLARKLRPRERWTIANVRFRVRLSALLLFNRIRSVGR
jgi:hypothetical protein